MASSIKRDFDIVLFGVTGFTGRYVLEELYRTKGNRKIAVAGRSETGIKKILLESSVYLEEPHIASVPIIIADVNDYPSLVKMTESTRLIINAVGPYQKFGEQVIKACVESGTHQVDISGEPIYLETVQLKYNQLAIDKKIFLIGACGADSIPADLGIVYGMKKFPGQLNEIESFLDFTGKESYPINAGTLDSAMTGIANRSALRGIRSQLFPSRLPKPLFPQPNRGTLFKWEGSWCMVFPGSDRSVVVRSQRHLVEQQGKHRTPVQYSAYLCEKSFCSTLKTIWCGIMILSCSFFNWSQSFFIRNAGFLSMGMFSNQGASRSQLRDGSFILTFIGKGWKDTSQVDKLTPTDTIKYRMTGPEFGYISCSICVVQAAFTILDEANLMPNKGGALPPGAAFYDTSLLERLQSRSIKFEDL